MAIQFNPVGGAYNGVKPLKSDTTLTLYNTIEAIARYDQKDVIGPFYPVKCLPSLYVDGGTQAPVVMPAGNVVSIVPVGKSSLLPDGGTDVTGIDSSGNIYTTIGVDGNKYQKPYTFLYGADVVGLIVPCNGTAADVNISYSSVDADAGILTASGELPTASDVYTLKPRKPLGIALQRVFGDIRERYQQFTPVNSSVGVVLKGYLTVPFISIAADMSDIPTATAVNSFLKEVGKYHQFVYALQEHTLGSGDDLAVFASGASVGVDQSGKFAIDDSYAQFGKIVSLREQAVRDLDEVVDTFPGSKLQGTATAGLSSRMYDFGSKALALTAVSATPANVRDAYFTVVNMKSGLTGRIVYGLIDILFGF